MRGELFRSRLGNLRLRSSAPCPLSSSRYFNRSCLPSSQVGGRTPHFSSLPATSMRRRSQKGKRVSLATRASFHCLGRPVVSAYWHCSRSRLEDLVSRQP